MRGRGKCREPGCAQTRDDGKDEWLGHRLTSGFFNNAGQLRTIVIGGDADSLDRSVQEKPLAIGGHRVSLAQ